MADNILDVVDPQALTLAARALPFPGGILQRWLPDITRLDHRYRFFRRDRALRRAAPYRGWDTPAVPIERGQAEEVTGRMLPISDILWLLEEEAQLLDAARASGDADAALAAYDNDLREVVRRIQQAVMLKQGEAIAHGTVTFGTEDAPENGLQLGSVEFGIPDAHYIDAPEAWSATPEILTQLGDYATTYKTTTGNEVEAGVAIISTRILSILASDSDFTGAYATAFGQPPVVGEAEINQLLERRRLPRIIVDDTAVPDHTGAMTRQIPDNRIVFLPSDRPVGQTQWGTTEEAKRLARAQRVDPANMPGLVVVPMESENPVRTGLLGAAIVMPVVTEPDLIMSVQVLDLA